LKDRSDLLYDLIVIERGDVFLEKAEESLAGAESEFAGGRYNNCANRCYYASFQAAISALSRAGIAPPGSRGYWGHDFVLAQFGSQLINRRKVFPTELRGTLEQNFRLRETADYERGHVSEVRASRAVQRTQIFVAAVQRQRARQP
jgi:uncharacterized protein (UPF0332 family)